ncbi:MAG: hypothetical protein IPJ34_25730 [Myxococcales bacterium]|nr:hypothetical protein [Myxococcales bacterium]
MDAERGDRDGDGELEVVGRRGERQRGGARVVGAQPLAHEERHREHRDEVDEERQRDAQDVERELHDRLALEREHHHDGEEERDQRERADARHEPGLVPLEALGRDEHAPSEEPRGERDAEIDCDALGDVADADGDHRALQPEPGGEQGREEPGVHREEEHLEDRVERHETGAVLGVTLREVVPHDHHRDAPGQADEDQPEHVLGLVPEEHDREREHQDRADDPVLHQRQGEDLLVAEDEAELLVADLGERRVHHDDEPDRDGHRGGADAEPREPRRERRHPEAERDPDAHREEDPQRQEAVEETELPGYGVVRHGVVPPRHRSSAMRCATLHIFHSIAWPCIS